MKLEWGRYSLDYTRNGRHLLLGSEKGHLAMLDWKRKSIVCEINVKETIRNVKFLHNENMFAVKKFMTINIRINNTHHRKIRFSYIYILKMCIFRMSKIISRQHREDIPIFMILMVSNFTNSVVM